jgi:chemotaxis protein MotB
LGHTDNVPIRTSSYPSNWELSAARALAAVRFLVDDGGVDPKRIAAVAHGEFQPISSNSTPERRARNRRITIVFLPEVFKTPEEPIEETDPAIESELVETSSELVPVEDTGPEIGTANDSREGLEQSTVDSPEPIPDQG